MSFIIPHTITVDPITGTLVANVPLQTPSARGGFAPAFQLDYRSGASNSLFGVGWNLNGLLAITVDLADGLPRYDNGDTFTFTASGALVPFATGPAPDAPDRWEDRGTHRIRRFRARVERGYQRVEQWIDNLTQRVHWRSFDARGAITIFGAANSGLSRIADPADSARVFQWLPDIQFDTQGNAIRFDYLEEDTIGVDLAAAGEASRFQAGVQLAQRHLKRVRWGNSLPVTSNSLDPPGQRWSFELVFDYGDHDPANPGTEPDRAWGTRPDPFSTCNPGFELRTYRLCRRILIFHRFNEIGPDAVLAGIYELDHNLKPEGSTLTRVLHVGVRQDAGVTSSRAHPPLKFTYTTPRVADEFRAAPSVTLDTVPHGLDAPRFRWMDLLGEGLPGILVEEHDAWYYKRNEGEGRFGRDILVTERPAYRLADVHMQDFDGDGNPNLTVVGSRRAGYYEFDRATEQWQGFQAFRSIPHLDAVGRRAEWLDLDGDGLAELLLADADRLTWFRSLGKEGFDVGVELQSPEPLAGGVAAALRDAPSLRYFFADMNGDGLADQVVVRNGLVAYWPNLGHGRFGPALLMDGAPWFAPEAEFDPSRLMFVDLDGSGTADLLYIGDGEITYWTNACGNRLLSGRTLRGLPCIDNVSSTRVLDFLGDGTPCLVWSTPLPGGVANLHYLPLTDGVRAGLLAETNNSIGLVRRVTYGTSAKHYLRDRAAGSPWHTRLASHVTVVDRLDTLDEIGGARMVSRFEYHDGCFDGRDRRFIGFGCIESFDTEETPSGDPLAPLTTGSCTRTFVHLGVDGVASLERAWNADSAAPNPAAYVFEGTAILGEDDLLDGVAAVAGQIVRQELFAMPAGGPRAQHPIRVDQSGFLLRPLQRAGGGRRASFAAITREQISAVYEQTANDPRITHLATLDTDAYGGTTLTCSIAYPRRAAIAAADPEQRRLRAAAERTTTIHIDTATEYQPLIGVEQESFELPGVAAPVTGFFSWEALKTLVTAALLAPEPHDAVVVPAGSAQRTAWSRIFYYAADGINVAGFGSAFLPIRVHHVEEAAFSINFANVTYGARVDATRLRNEGLYLDHSNHWWRVGETFGYAGSAQFYRVENVTRLNGSSTTFAYDSASLFVVETADAAGNRARLTYDYFAMAPARSVDENDNVSETVYDALGAVVVSTHQGEVLDEAGVPRLYGFDRLSGLAIATSASPETVLANPAAHLQSAALAVVYDFDRWTVNGEPPVVVEVAREMLAHDGTGTAPAASRVLVSVKHLDGFERTLQQKHRVEPGDAIRRAGDGSLILDAGKPAIGPSAERWLVSGHTVFNTRQEAARVFESFFSTTWRFEPDAELAQFGVVHSFLYDAAGRQVRHDHPNGTHERAEFAAWSKRTFDTNDTVDDSTYRLQRELLPSTDPERLALDRARAHAGTPITVHLDPLGQEIVQTEASGDGQERTLRTTYGPDGLILSVHDARGVESMNFMRDMLGREIRIRSADAGEELVFMDGMDRPLENWKGSGLHIVRHFDVLDRLLTVDADGLPGLNRRVQEFTYGESPEVTDAARRNLRGRTFRIRDSSGTRTILRNTPFGDALEANRRITADPETLPDWRFPLAASLLPDVFVMKFAYDALRRPIRHALADGAVVNHDFTLAGGVQRATISTSDGLLTNQLIFDGADFNARGQRIHLRLGNGVEVSQGFEPNTWRTSSIVASRAGAVLQDLRYTYDPAGNVIRSLDRTHEPGATSPFLSNVTVSAERRFMYDAFYRLREATGRIHRAVLPDDHRTNPPGAGTFKGARRLSFNDGGQLERYTELFTYDLSGNLTQMRHQGIAVNWTRDFWISATSNRSLPALDENGIPVVNPENHFDASGNCIRLPHLRRMDWDHMGMPARAVIIDRSASGEPDDDELYLHDSDGERVRKLTRRFVGGGVVETTDVLYLDGCEIKRIERGPTRLLERRTTHVFDQSNRVATVHRWTIDINSRETTDTTRPRVHFHLADHLGSALLQLDETGQVIAYEEYLPYGNTAFLAGDNVREIEMRAYRYAGKERDDGTGLYYFGHRYYAPWLGRWMSPDPAGPVDDLNLYQYAQNNPISNFDPDGLQTRGREVTVAGQTPPDVEAAFRRLPQARQEELRGLMQRGNFGWMYEAQTGQFHFGNRAEIARRVEALLASGQNVGRLVAPGSQRGADGQGGQGGRSPTARQRGRGSGSQTQSGSQSQSRRGGRQGRQRGTSTGGQAPTDGTRGQARGPTGTPSDSHGTGRASDTGGNTVNAGDGSQTDAPPGSGGTGGDAGTGGNGTSGSGPGANPESTRSGTGGGGTDESPNAMGTGDQGEGTGGGSGTGRGQGSGDQPGESEARAGGEGIGTGESPGENGGTGTTGHGQPGGRPGGDPAAHGTGSTQGQPGSSTQGQTGGDPAGAPGGSANGSPGTGATSGTPGTGTGTGNENGPRGNVGSGPGGGGTRQAQGQQGGRGQEPGGQRGGGARQRPTVMDRVARVAGWWHLEFSGDPRGQSGGIPGGFGSHNLGAFGQALFVALTVVDIALTIASLGGLAGIKAGLRAAISAARRVLSSVGRRIAAAWARRRAMRAAMQVATRRVVQTFSLRQVAARAASGFRQWFAFSNDLGGVARHTFTRFYAFARTTIHNRDWAAGRIIGAIDTAVHEGFHWLMSKVPFWRSHQIWRVGGQPIGAVLNWAEETAAYALGHTAALRVHGILAAPIEAFVSVYANFGGGAAGRSAVAWAIGELAVIGGGVAAYFGLRDRQPAEAAAP